MFKSGYLLNTEDKIDAAIFNKSKIRIYQNGFLLEKGAIIEKQTEEAIVVRGNYYLKAICECQIH